MRRPSTIPTLTWAGGTPSTWQGCSTKPTPAPRTACARAWRDVHRQPAGHRRAPGHDARHLKPGRVHDQHRQDHEPERDPLARRPQGPAPGRHRDAQRRAFLSTDQGLPADAPTHRSPAAARPPRNRFEHRNCRSRRKNSDRIATQVPRDSGLGTRGFLPQQASSARQANRRSARDLIHQSRSVCRKANRHLRQRRHTERPTATPRITRHRCTFSYVQGPEVPPPLARTPLVSRLWSQSTWRFAQLRTAPGREDQPAVASHRPGVNRSSRQKTTGVGKGRT